MSSFGPIEISAKMPLRKKSTVILSDGERSVSLPIKCSPSRSRRTQVLFQMIVEEEGTPIVSSHSRCLYIGVTSPLLEERNLGHEDLALPDAMQVLRLGSLLRRAVTASQRNYCRPQDFASLRMTD
jgi:hypothetical protein